LQSVAVAVALTQFTTQIATGTHSVAVEVVGKRYQCNGFSMLGLML
jgi:hypothetical protein